MLASSISAVGVYTPVQVTPPSVDVITESVPFATVTSSALLKFVTASLNVIVTFAVSPAFNATSSIWIDNANGLISNKSRSITPFASS